jgi:hypothetical protein
MNGRHGTRTDILAVYLVAPNAADIILNACAVRDIGLLEQRRIRVQEPHQRNDVSAISELLLVNCHTPMALTRAFRPRYAGTRA